MPVVNTGGFQVQNMPRVDFADPRLLAPAYGNIIPSISQGMGLYGNFRQMGEDEQMRPTRKRLAEIKLAEAEQGLANYPLEQRRMLAQIAEAEQNAAVPRQIADVIEMSGGGKRLTAIDPNASFESFGITEEFAPRIRTTRGTSYGPGGVTSPFSKIETLATSEQVKSEADKAADLADYRAGIAEARMMNAKTAAELATAKADTDKYRAESDRIRAIAARDRAAYLEQRPGVGFVDVKKPDGKTYRQYFTKGNPQQIIHEVDRGDVGGDNFFNFGDTVIQPNGKKTGFGALGRAANDLDAALGGRASALAGEANDKYETGKTYEDSSGNTAKYLGNGKWQETP